MKKNLLLIFLLMKVFFTSFSQIGAFSEYKKLDFDPWKAAPYFERDFEIQQAAYEETNKKLNAAYSKTRKYKDDLINWTFELKSNISDSQLWNNIDSYYFELKKISESLARNQSFEYQNDAVKYINKTYNDLKNIELGIRELVENYFKNLKEQNNPQNVYTDGMELYNKKSYQAAIGKFSLCIESSPNVIHGYLMRGKCYFDLQNYLLAINDFNEALKIDPKDYFSTLYRAVSYFELKNYYDALNGFTQLIALKPTDVFGYFWRGRAKGELKDFYGSNADYLKVIELDSNYSMAYNNLGWNYFEKQDYKKAFEYVNKALLIDSLNYVALDSRAEINFNLNKFHDAISDANKALLLNSKIPNCYFIIGRSKYRLNRKDDACINWSKAGELGKVEAYEYISKYCK